MIVNLIWVMNPTLLTYPINKNNKILFLIILIASLTILNADYHRSLILNKGSSQQMINTYDLILIKCIDGSFTGQFIRSENNFILFLVINTLSSKKFVKRVHVNDIEAIYIGNIKSPYDLYLKWFFIYSLVTLPTGIDWGYSNKVVSVPGFPAAMSMWSFLNLGNIFFYAPVSSYIDFEVRKTNATEFIIGKNEWIIIHY